jgi:hypothetical protein
MTMKQKKPDLYSPDARNVVDGIYPPSQCPSVSWVEDENGRRLFLTDHDSFVVDEIMPDNPLNGPSFLTPAELESLHSFICENVIPPDWNYASENPGA